MHFLKDTAIISLSHEYSHFWNEESFIIYTSLSFIQIYWNPWCFWGWIPNLWLNKRSEKKRYIFFFAPFYIIPKQNSSSRSQKRSVRSIIRFSLVWIIVSTKCRNSIHLHQLRDTKGILTIVEIQWFGGVFLRIGNFTECDGLSTCFLGSFCNEMLVHRWFGVWDLQLIIIHTGPNRTSPRDCCFSVYTPTREESSPCWYVVFDIAPYLRIYVASRGVGGK